MPSISKARWLLGMMAQSLFMQTQAQSFSWFETTSGLAGSTVTNSVPFSDTHSFQFIPPGTLALSTAELRTAVDTSKPLWLVLADTTSCSRDMYMLEMTQNVDATGKISTDQGNWRWVNITGLYTGTLPPPQSGKSTQLITTGGIPYLLVFGGTRCNSNSGPNLQNSDRLNDFNALNLKTMVWTRISLANNGLGGGNAPKNNIVIGSAARDNTLLVRFSGEGRVFPVHLGGLPTGATMYASTDLLLTNADKGAALTFLADPNSNVLYALGHPNTPNQYYTMSFNSFNNVAGSALTSNVVSTTGNLPPRTGDRAVFVNNTIFLYGGYWGATTSSSKVYDTVWRINLSNNSFASQLSTATRNFFRYNVNGLAAFSSQLFAYGGDVFTDPIMYQTNRGSRVAYNEISVLDLSLADVFYTFTLTLAPLPTIDLGGYLQSLVPTPATAPPASTTITSTIDLASGDGNPQANNIFSATLYIIIGAGGAAGIVLLIIVVVLLRKRKPKPSLIDQPLGAEEGMTTLTGGQTESWMMTRTGMGTTMFTTGKVLALPGFLMLMKDLDFNLGKQVAEGGAGIVYFGTLKNDGALRRNNSETRCVVKVMKDLEDASKDDVSVLFNQEVSIMWLLHESKNVLKLLGFCPQPQMIIMKFYSCGSLEELIHKQGNYQELVPDNQWTPKFILRMMRDLAAGLKDMHENGIVHNDIKPANILIDRDPDGTLFGVLCDFGVAAIIDESLLRVKAYRRSRVKGASLVYAAPEVLRSFQTGREVDELKEPDRFKGSDIYSYAMVIYELTYRRIPWWDVDNLDDIVKMVIAGERPQLGKGLLDRCKADPYLATIVRLMNECSVPNPLKRTSMEQCMIQINALLGSGPGNPSTMSRPNGNLGQVPSGSNAATTLARSNTKKQGDSRRSDSPAVAPRDVIKPDSSPRATENIVQRQPSQTRVRPVIQPEMRVSAPKTLAESLSDIAGQLRQSTAAANAAPGTLTESRSGSAKDLRTGPKADAAESATGLARNLYNRQASRSRNDITSQVTQGQVETANVVSRTAAASGAIVSQGKLLSELDDVLNIMGSKT